MLNVVDGAVPCQPSHKAHTHAHFQNCHHQSAVIQQQQDGAWKKRDYQLLMHTARQPPPYQFPLEYIPAWPLRAKQTGKEMWKLDICTWFKDWAGKRWQQPQREKTGDTLLLPLFLLRRSLIAARIIFLSSKSFDSSSCVVKRKKKSHECKQRGHSSQKPKVAPLYLCTHS